MTRPAQFSDVPIAWIARACVIAAFVLAAFAQLNVAHALDAFPITVGQDKVELTQKGVALGGRGDRLQIDTAPGNDGISRRMSVNATNSGANPNWIVFALTNTTDKTVTRWITVQRYSLIGSGVIWPDLDSRRMTALTPSVGFLPQRIANDRADIFKIEIEPGQTITYAAEMASARLSRIYMWEPLAYELHVRERRLFNGIMLGITGLLGIFLTAVFAANHKAIFPSAALVTWCVLVYLCVDFGFWHKLLQISADDNSVYRAAAEAAMATSIAIFLHTFLRLGSWHGFARMLSSVWIIAQLAIVFIAVLDPRLASTFARLSFAALGGVGALLILFLAVRGQDRALSIIPTWLLFLVWLFGAAMTLTGKLNGDIVVSSLVAGLVLITVLIGFTVTQFAFRSVEPHYGAAPSEQQLRSLAVEGAGAAVWEWHSRRGEIKVGAVAEMALGLNVGELSTKAKEFVRYLHPADRERFNVLLWTLQNKGGGEIRTDFRMRHADNSYRWFDLEAASIATSDRRSVRCVGLLRDVTDQKRSQARLIQDAVIDSLTGLPNRELFIDRMKTAVSRVANEPQLRPTVLFIDLDRFKGVNSNFGLLVGDSLLLTISRRLSRHLQPMDTLARLGGDRFAMLVLSVADPAELARLAESVRRSLRAPIKIAGQDIVLTGTIGIAVHDPESTDELDMLKHAEIAMFRAKRHGADQIEIFRPDMQDGRNDQVALEADLRRALERRQIKVLYQPIIYLPTEELAGFEAIVQWEHPSQGILDPQDYVPISEDSDLSVKLGAYVFSEAVAKAVEWQKKLPRAKHQLFVSVNVSSRQLFRQDLIQEIRHILSHAAVPKDVLRIEITESLVMENPERAAEILEMLKLTGVGLALDDFGTGYSSLAYLDRFPFQTIKMDRHIVHAAGVDSETGGSGSAIVRSIVAMAKEMEKKVVAEGVETSQDVGFLRSIGCQYAQGYYYGEAMPERDVVDLLKIVRKSERKHQRRGIFGALVRKPKDQQETKDEQQQLMPPGDQPQPAAVAAKQSQPAAAPAMPIEAPPSPPAAPPSNGTKPEVTQPSVGSAAQPVPPQPPRSAPPLPAGSGPRPNGAAQPPQGMSANGPAPTLMPPAPSSGSSQSPVAQNSEADGSSTARPDELETTVPRRMPPPHWRQPPRPGAPEPRSAVNDASPQSADDTQGRSVIRQSSLRAGDQPAARAQAPAGPTAPPPMPPPSLVTPSAQASSKPVTPVTLNAEGPSLEADDATPLPTENKLQPTQNGPKDGALSSLSDLSAPKQRRPVSVAAAPSATPERSGPEEVSAPMPQQPTSSPPATAAPRADASTDEPAKEAAAEAPASGPRTGDFSTLPAGIAESLARLAGGPITGNPANDKGTAGSDRQKKVEAGE